ncbi:MAG: helix-turn-helix domain-containing protein [Acidimicrobiia bacterium]|nr:helix-turn-helix domain-containing protein [Acidimicrobiia bacterium]
MELRRVELTSPQLRCLANTIRSRLLAALRLEGPATSAALAKRLETNTGVTSYHLRRLADVGLIVDHPDLGRGRERVWQAAHDVTVWTETAFDVDPDDRAARDWMIGHHSRLTNAWRQEWMETRGDWSTEWREAACTSDMTLRLSPERTKALVAELESVIERYAATAKDDVAADQTESAGASVAVLIDVFPSHRLTI